MIPIDDERPDCMTSAGHHPHPTSWHELSTAEVLRFVIRFSPPRCSHDVAAAKFVAAMLEGRRPTLRDWANGGRQP